jgi:hypothetical protein
VGIGERCSPTAYLILQARTLGNRIAEYDMTLTDMKSDNLGIPDTKYDYSSFIYRIKRYNDGCLGVHE